MAASPLFCLTLGPIRAVSRLGSRLRQHRLGHPSQEALRQRPLVALQESASFGRGLWTRLNGGGKSKRGVAAEVLDRLPAVRSDRAEHDARMVQLALQVEAVRVSKRSPPTHAACQHSSRWSV